MSGLMLLSIFLAASGVGETWIRSNWDEAGGGLEIALCSNYRVVLNDPNIKIGFPGVY